MIELFLAICGIYLLGGMVFGVAFAFKGARVVDPAAVEGTWGFKLLIIPGAAVFWPVLALRWLKKASPSEECSAHRAAARHRNR